MGDPQTDAGEKGITVTVAEYIASARIEDLPSAIVHEAKRAILNIVGCTIGGARHRSVDAVWAALAPFAGAEQATLIGRGARSDAITASLINCLSSSVYTYDDAHAEAVVHPSGPIACALLALSESRPVSGADFLIAFILGVEFACRLSKSISVKPAKGSIAWSQTGVVGGIGAAIAAGKLLGLPPCELIAAIAMAVSQSAGIRTAQGTAASGLMPAQGAPAGLRAALFAQQGLAGSQDPLQSKYGFVNVFSEHPNAAALVDGLGSDFEVGRLTYKPYPCGIVLVPVIDACLALKHGHALQPATISRVTVRVNPVALALTDRRAPKDALAAQVSIYHWTAIPLCDGQAGLAGLRDDRLQAADIVTLRNKVDVVTDQAIATDAAKVIVTLSDGRRVSHAIDHCVGSASRPMRDDELELKFRQQCEEAITSERIGFLMDSCRAFESVSDVGAVVRAAA